jgi:hypothetical protein
MATFELYLESVKDKPNPTTYEAPDETLTERNLQKALKKFARKNQLEYVDHDHLINDDGYRAYFEKKKGDSYIYYVRTKSE